jgi:hypothetical protein
MYGGVYNPTLPQFSQGLFQYLSVAENRSLLQTLHNSAFIYSPYIILDIILKYDYFYVT